MDVMTRSPTDDIMLQLTSTQISTLIGSGGGYPHIEEWIVEV